MEEISESKKLKSEVKEDRISALPDSLIQHILSFLPSTKEAIQTGILSNRWQNQWTRVPVLIFRYSGNYSIDKFSRIIDNTLILHDCPKIKKFHIKLYGNIDEDPPFNSKLRFAIRKDVEDLLLEFCNLAQPFKLPKFLFDNPSLVKLQMSKCSFRWNERANWGSLKEFELWDCKLVNKAIESILSSCHALELLSLNYCYGFDRLIIASKSLKRLFLGNLRSFVLKISCPNLRELDAWFSVSGKVIKDVLSGSPLLQSLDLLTCGGCDQLVLASSSLRKLVLGDMVVAKAIEISCPNLEELELSGLGVERIKFMNLPSSVCASLEFKSDSGCGENLARMILEQLQHVKELKMGSWFIQILSALEVKGASSPLLSNTCLAMDGGPSFEENIPGIAYALRSSPVLEKLVMNLHLFEESKMLELVHFDISSENYWNSNGTHFSCLVSHLKTVEVQHLSEIDGNFQLVLDFVEFVLKNARVLEKLVISLEPRGTCFDHQVSQKLLSFPRCSQHAIVELIYLNFI